mgnify:CR=1 FL=1
MTIFDIGDRIWTTKDGQKIKYRDLTESHIKNIAKKTFRTIYQYTSIVDNMDNDIEIEEMEVVSMLFNLFATKSPFWPWLFDRDEDFGVFLKLGDFEIRWYAICILLGALIALVRCRYELKKKGYNFAGWLLNGADYDFDNTPVTANIIAMAKSDKDIIVTVILS